MGLQIGYWAWASNNIGASDGGILFSHKSFLILENVYRLQHFYLGLSGIAMQFTFSQMHCPSNSLVSTQTLVPSVPNGGIKLFYQRQMMVLSTHKRSTRNSYSITTNDIFCAWSSSAIHALKQPRNRRTRRDWADQTTPRALPSAGKFPNPQLPPPATTQNPVDLFSTEHSLVRAMRLPWLIPTRNYNDSVVIGRTTWNLFDINTARGIECTGMISWLVDCGNWTLSSTIYRLVPEWSHMPSSMQNAEFHNNHLINGNIIHICF